MAATFYTLLTKLGLAAVANATALNVPVNLTKMAVGDGGGAATTPKETQTALVAQKYSANLNQLTIDTSNPNYLIAEMIIPTTVGGWYVREVGIFDSAGNLFAIANFPDTYKPQLAEGSGRDLVIRIVIQVSNASAVTLLVDPAVTLASQAWVTSNFVSKTKLSGGADKQVLAKSSAASQDYTWRTVAELIDNASTAKKGLTQLSSVVDSSEDKAATPKAVQSVSPGRLINVQSFTASGTYVPTPGTKSIIVEVLGGGGGGGGASASSATTVGLGGGGGGGGYAKSYLTVVPASQSVVVGLGGASYTAGGDSSFGTITGKGGVRGAQQLAGTWKGGDPVQQRPSSPGGQAQNGNLINAAGSYGSSCFFTVFGNCISGCGGGSFYSGTTFPADSNSAGTNGAIGCGGSGAAANGSTATLNGGSGGNGIVMVWEYA